MKPKNRKVQLPGVVDAWCGKVMLEMNEVSGLVGKLLTVADASFQDKQQREAVKSLIKQMVWDWSKEWHLGVNEEELKKMQENSETCEHPGEPQVKHYDD